MEVEVFGSSREQLVYRSVVLQQGDGLPGAVGGTYQRHVGVLVGLSAVGILGALRRQQFEANCNRSWPAGIGEFGARLATLLAVLTVALVDLPEVLRLWFRQARDLECELEPRVPLPEGCGAARDGIAHRI